MDKFIVRITVTSVFGVSIGAYLIHWLQWQWVSSLIVAALLSGLIMLPLSIVSEVRRDRPRIVIVGEHEALKRLGAQVIVPDSRDGDPDEKS